MIAAIIQARIGSTRLPGKTLKKILGKPMLWHLINRLKHSKHIDKVIIATTKRKQDEQIVRFAKEQGLEYYRGSERDVLDRFYQTAKKFNIETIVRVTPDCPLIDPEVVDMVIGKYFKNKEKVDYVSNTWPRVTFPDGMDTEVFSFKILKKTWQETKWSSDREHVTSYIRRNPNLFKFKNVTNNKDLSSYRLTVDTREDFFLVKKIMEGLYSQKKIFKMAEIIDFLNHNPRLFKISQQEGNGRT